MQEANILPLRPYDEVNRFRRCRRLLAETHNAIKSADFTV